jgi:hypothetical protein
LSGQAGKSARYLSRANKSIESALASLRLVDVERDAANDMKHGAILLAHGISAKGICSRRDAITHVNALFGTEIKVVDFAAYLKRARQALRKENSGRG